MPNNFHILNKKYRRVVNLYAKKALRDENRQSFLDILYYFFNLFVTDPKGELFEHNARHLDENGYRIFLLNFKDITRSNKWIRLGNFDLLDTPGTMPPSFENQIYARHLAYIGAINDDILDMEGLALELIKDLKVIAPESFKEKYKLETLDKEGLDLFDDVCKKRGFLLRGGESDYTRCSRAIIDDFRKQRIGKICLEVTPNDGQDERKS